MRQCAHFQHILSNILSISNILKPIIVWMIEKCMNFHYYIHWPNVSRHFLNVSSSWFSGLFYSLQSSVFCLKFSVFFVSLQSSAFGLQHSVFSLQSSVFFLLLSFSIFFCLCLSSSVFFCRLLYFSVFSLLCSALCLLSSVIHFTFCLVLQSAVFFFNLQYSVFWDTPLTDETRRYGFPILPLFIHFTWPVKICLNEYKNKGWSYNLIALFEFDISVTRLKG